MKTILENQLGEAKNIIYKKIKKLNNKYYFPTVELTPHEKLLKEIIPDYKIHFDVSNNIHKTASDYLEIYQRIIIFEKLLKYYDSPLAYKIATTLNIDKINIGILDIIKILLINSISPIRCKTLEELFLSSTIQIRENDRKNDTSTWCKTLLKFLGKDIICQKCGSLKNIETHHKKYPARSINDIEILCKSCHVKLHWKIGNEKEQFLFEEYKNGINLEELSNRYNVPIRTILLIIKNKYSKQRKKQIKIIKLLIDLYLIKFRLKKFINIKFMPIFI